MKNLLFIFIAALLFISCSSTNKNFQKGNYDEVVSKAIKKLIKNPDSNKDAVLLDKAFKLANERDLDALKFLKQEGQPDNYDKILRYFEQLKYRQNQVKAVLPLKLNGQMTNYQIVDYDAEIISAKTKAAAYFYANGKRLLLSDDKLLIRQSYNEFMRAKSYAGSAYPDLNDLLKEAKFKGISRVFVQLENASQFNFPPEFFERILSGNINQLNSEWVQYFFKDSDSQIDFDYVALVKLLNVQVSPDDVKTIDRIYKKNVQDGFEYVLDAAGNVKKDSTGKDIKRIKYKALQCALVESVQHKQARLDGEIQYYELKPFERLIGQTPFGTENDFHHVSARAIGDVAALDDEALQKIKSQVVPFPTDQQLVFDNAIRVQEAIFRILRSNQTYFK
jgi:hypothetical protein